MWTVGVLGTVAALLVVLRVAGAKFERRRRREGEWDEQGPKHPTEPPLEFLAPRAGSGLPPEMGSRPWAEKYGWRYRWWGRGR